MDGHLLVLFPFFFFKLLELIRKTTSAAGVDGIAVAVASWHSVAFARAQRVELAALRLGRRLLCCGCPGDVHGCWGGHRLDHGLSRRRERRLRLRRLGP